MTFDGLMAVYVINLTSSNRGGGGGGLVWSGLVAWQWMYRRTAHDDCIVDCEFACPNFGGRGEYPDSWPTN